MKGNARFFINRSFVASTLILLIILLATCGSPQQTGDPNLQIRIAVQQTLAAIPSDTPYPIPTPYPSPTPIDLSGVFCEYQFCIGHPADMAFYDVSAVKSNNGAPSAYAQGILASYNAVTFIEVIWQTAPGTKDAQFLLDLILKETGDTPTGNLDVKLVRDMNVIFTAITPPSSSTLTAGGAGAWTCGDRAFAWKAYTQQAETAASLFNNALARFTCNQ